MAIYDPIFSDGFGLAKNLSDCVSLHWKLDNPYYQIEDTLPVLSSSNMTPRVLHIPRMDKMNQGIR